LLDIDVESSSLNLPAAIRDVGDQQLMLTMVNMFLGEWDRHLHEIAKAIDDQDRDQLTMTAHTVKSLLAMFHAEKARRLAADLELVTKAGASNVDWQKCRQLAELLNQEMVKLKPAFELFASEKTPSNFI